MNNTLTFSDRHTACIQVGWSLYFQSNKVSCNRSLENTKRQKGFKHTSEVSLGFSFILKQNGFKTCLFFTQKKILLWWKWGKNILRTQSYHSSTFTVSLNRKMCYYEENSSGSSSFYFLRLVSTLFLSRYKHTALIALCHNNVDIRQVYTHTLPQSD